MLALSMAAAAAALRPVAAAPPEAAARRQLLSTMLSLRHWTTKELRAATNWDKVQIKTEFVAAQHARLVARKLPTLRRLMRQHPSIAATTDLNRQTPLHYAAWVGGVDLVRAVMDEAADTVGARDLLGQTPLHKAVMRGNVHELSAMLRASPPELHAEIAQFADGGGSGVPPPAYERLFGRKQRRALTDAPPPAAAADCPPDGGWGDVPPPTDAHCDIDRRTALSPTEFHSEYFLRGRPVLLRGEIPLSERCALQKSALQRAGELHKPRRCGTSAYPALTRQRLCEQSFTLQSMRHGAKCSGGVSPTCTAPALTATWHAHNTTLPYSLLSSRFLEQNVPPVPPLSGWWRGTSRFQFFMGDTGSGAALHFHRDAYNAVFFGEKDWFIAPPVGAGLSGVPTARWHASASLPGMPAGPYRCTQRAGDVVVLPSHWGHATLNRGMTLSTGNLYCAEARRGAGVGGADPTCSRQSSAHPAARGVAKGESALFLFPTREDLGRGDEDRKRPRRLSR
eukprot:TRINITY_DN25050_c0_g1_i1.p1 TRINITY_DN25050_c0_g1~~TRINITY_DN25050_c0_g1_i1.p1  ORF type:complete len:525 (+),score=164.60 TRINITY_DN25050_c0_g1_i1:48-1577(+)